MFEKKSSKNLLLLPKIEPFVANCFRSLIVSIMLLMNYKSNRVNITRVLPGYLYIKGELERVEGRLYTKELAESLLDELDKDLKSW